MRQRVSQNDLEESEESNNSSVSQTMSDDVAQRLDEVSASETASADGGEETIGLGISLSEDGRGIDIPEVIVSTLEDEELTITALDPCPVYRQLLHVPKPSKDSKFETHREPATHPRTELSGSSESSTTSEVASSGDSESPSSSWSDSSSDESGSDSDDEASSAGPTEGSSKSSWSDSPSDDSNSDSDSESGSGKGEDSPKDAAPNEAAASPASGLTDGERADSTSSSWSDSSSDESDSDSDSEPDKDEVDLKDPKDTVSPNPAASSASPSPETATDGSPSSSWSDSSSDGSDSDSDSETGSEDDEADSKNAATVKARPPPPFAHDKEATSLYEKGLPLGDNNLAWFSQKPAAYWIGPSPHEWPRPYLEFGPRQRKRRDSLEYNVRRNSLKGPDRPRSRLSHAQKPEDLEAEEAAAGAATRARRRASAPVVPPRGPPLDQSLFKDFESVGAFVSREDSSGTKAPGPVLHVLKPQRPVSRHGSRSDGPSFLELFPPAQSNDIWPDRRETLTPPRRTRSLQENQKLLRREKIHILDKARQDGQIHKMPSLLKLNDPIERLYMVGEKREELENKLEQYRKALADTIKERDREYHARNEANERIAELEKRIRELEEELQRRDSGSETADSSSKKHELTSDERTADTKTRASQKDKEQDRLAEQRNRLAMSISLWFEHTHMMNDGEGRLPTTSEVKEHLAASCTFSDFCQSLLDTGVKFEVDELAQELIDSNISSAPELKDLSTAGKNLQDQVNSLLEQQEQSKKRTAELEQDVKKSGELMAELTTNNDESKKNLQLKQAELDAAINNAKKQQEKRLASYKSREDALLQQVQRLREKNDGLTQEGNSAAELKKELMTLQGQFLDAKSELIAAKKEKIELQKSLLSIERDLRRSSRAQQNAGPVPVPEDVQALREKYANMEMKLQEVSSELRETERKLQEITIERDDAAAKWETFAGSEEGQRTIELEAAFMELDRVQQALLITQQDLWDARQVNADFGSQIDDLRIERSLLLNRVCGTVKEKQPKVQGFVAPLAEASSAEANPTSKKDYYARLREERAAETRARLRQFDEEDYQRQMRWQQYEAHLAQRESSPAPSQGRSSSPASSQDEFVTAPPSALSRSVSPASSRTLGRTPSPFEGPAAEGSWKNPPSPPKPAPAELAALRGYGRSPQPSAVIAQASQSRGRSVDRHLVGRRVHNW